MKTAYTFVLPIFVIFASASWAEPQKVYRVGAIVAEDQFLPAIDGFKQKMSELGYSESKNVIYELHNAKGDQDTLKKMAEILVQKKPDLIVTSSTTATVPIAKLTTGSNLPVVFLSVGDPLRLVKSYVSSGNNMTGITSSSIDLIPKRLQLLKTLSPGIKRVIILIDPAGTNYQPSLDATQAAARKLGLESTELKIQAKNVPEVKQQILLIKRSLGDGLLVPPEATLVAATEEITQQAIRETLPHVGPNVQTVKRGLLAAYSSNYHSLGQQGAALVDKILKGARPTDLPIETPYKLYSAINLKTAKAIGLDVPREIMLRADEVVE